jgi:hypothetical protein
MSIRIQLIFALATTLVLVGCIEGRQDIGSEVKKVEAGPIEHGAMIEDIIENQEAYDGKEVVVSGKVLSGLAFEFISEQPYRIIQGESMLWVITGDVSPKEGSFVTVRGRIARPYQIKGRSYQLVLLEEERL